MFEVSEEEVLLRGNVGGASNDRECLAHYCGFSQCFFVGLLEGFKCGLREARGGKRRPWLSNSPIDFRPIAWFLSAIIHLMARINIS